MLFNLTFSTTRETPLAKQKRTTIKTSKRSLVINPQLRSLYSPKMRILSIVSLAFSSHAPSLYLMLSTGVITRWGVSKEIKSKVVSITTERNRKEEKERREMKTKLNT